MAEMLVQMGDVEPGTYAAERIYGEAQAKAIDENIQVEARLHPEKFEWDDTEKKYVDKTPDPVTGKKKTVYVPGAAVDAFRRRYEERSEWRKGMGLTENDPADDQFNELYDKYLSTLKPGEDGYLHETDETDNATFIPDGVETPSDEDVQKTLKFREFVKGRRIKQMNSIADEFKKNFMAQRQKAFESGGREDLDGNIVDPGVNWNILYSAEENNKILSRVEDFMKMGYSEQKAWSAVLYSNHLLGGDSEKLFEKIYPDAKSLKTESEIKFDAPEVPGLRQAYNTYQHNVARRNLQKINEAEAERERKRNEYASLKEIHEANGSPFPVSEEDYTRVDANEESIPTWEEFKNNQEFYLREESNRLDKDALASAKEIEDARNDLEKHDGFTKTSCFVAESFNGSGYEELKSNAELADQREKGILEAGKEFITNASNIPITGFFVDIRNSIALAGALKRLDAAEREAQKGVDLYAQELGDEGAYQKRVDESIRNKFVNDYRSSRLRGTTLGYDITSATLNSLPMIAEFMISMGFANAAKSGVKAGAKAAANQAVNQAVNAARQATVADQAIARGGSGVFNTYKKVLNEAIASGVEVSAARKTAREAAGKALGQKLAAASKEAGGQFMGTFPYLAAPYTLKFTSERAKNEFMVYDENGIPHYNSDWSMTDVVAGGLYDAIREIGTEALGAYLDPALFGMGGALSKMRIGKFKLGSMIANGADFLRKRAGFHSPVGEIGEEYIGTGLDVITGWGADKDAMSGTFFDRLKKSDLNPARKESWYNLMVMTASFSIMPVFAGVTKAGANYAFNKRYRASLADKRFVDSWVKEHPEYKDREQEAMFPALRERYMGNHEGVELTDDESMNGKTVDGKTYFTKAGLDRRILADRERACTKELRDKSDDEVVNTVVAKTMRQRWSLPDSMNDNEAISKGMAYEIFHAQDKKLNGAELTQQVEEVAYQQFIRRYEINPGIVSEEDASPLRDEAEQAKKENNPEKMRSVYRRLRNLAAMSAGVTEEQLRESESVSDKDATQISNTFLRVGRNGTEARKHSFAEEKDKAEPVQNSEQKQSVVDPEEIEVEEPSSPYTVKPYERKDDLGKFKPAQNRSEAQKKVFTENVALDGHEVSVEQMTGEQAETAKAYIQFVKRFSRNDVVFFEFNEGAKFTSLKGHTFNKFIFIPASSLTSENNIVATFGHEFLHFLKKNPKTVDAYNALMKAVRDEIADNPKLKEYFEKRFAQYKGNRPDFSEEKAYEEVAGDINGMLFSQEGFLDNVLSRIDKEKKGLVGQIWFVFKHMYQKLMQIGRKSPSIRKVFTPERLEAIGNVFAKYNAEAVSKINDIKVKEEVAAEQPKATEAKATDRKVKTTVAETPKANEQKPAAKKRYADQFTGVRMDTANRLRMAEEEWTPLSDPNAESSYIQNRDEAEAYKANREEDLGNEFDIRVVEAVDLKGNNAYMLEIYKKQEPEAEETAPAPAAEPRGETVPAQNQEQKPQDEAGKDTNVQTSKPEQKKAEAPEANSENKVEDEKEKTPQIDELLCYFRDLPRGSNLDVTSVTAVRQSLESILNVPHINSDVKSGMLKIFNSITTGTPLSKKLPKPVVVKNFLTSLTDAGFKRKDGASVYCTSGSNTMRVSNHTANAVNFKKEKEENNNIISVVIEKPMLHKVFHPDKNVDLVEYVFMEDYLKTSGRLAVLVYDIANFLSTGEYIDHGVAFVNHYSGSEQFIAEAKAKFENKPKAQESALVQNQEQPTPQPVTEAPAVESTAPAAPSITPDAVSEIKETLNQLKTMVSEMKSASKGTAAKETVKPEEKPAEDTNAEAVKPAPVEDRYIRKHWHVLTDNAFDLPKAMTLAEYEWVPTFSPLEKESYFATPEDAQKAIDGFENEKAIYDFRVTEAYNLNGFKSYVVENKRKKEAPVNNESVNPANNNELEEKIVGTRPKSKHRLKIFNNLKVGEYMAFGITFRKLEDGNFMVKGEAEIREPKFMLNVFEKITYKYSKKNTVNQENTTPVSEKPAEKPAEKPVEKTSPVEVKKVDEEKNDDAEDVVSYNMSNFIEKGKKAIDISSKKFEYTKADFLAEKEWFPVVDPEDNSGYYETFEQAKKEAEKLRNKDSLFTYRVVEITDKKKKTFAIEMCNKDVAEKLAEEDTEEEDNTDNEPVVDFTGDETGVDATGVTPFVSEENHEENDYGEDGDVVDVDEDEDEENKKREKKEKSTISILSEKNGLNEKTEEELVEIIKSSKDDSIAYNDALLELFFNKYKNGSPYGCILQSGCVATVSDADIVFSNAVIKALKAIKKFNGENKDGKKVKFSTFFTTIAIRCAKSKARAELGKTQAPNQNNVSLNTPVTGKCGSVMEFGENIPDPKTQEEKTKEQLIKETRIRKQFSEISSQGNEVGAKMLEFISDGNSIEASAKAVGVRRTTGDTKRLEFIVSYCESMLRDNNFLNYKKSDVEETLASAQKKLEYLSLSSNDKFIASKINKEGGWDSIVNASDEILGNTSDDSELYDVYDNGFFVIEQHDYRDKPFEEVAKKLGCSIEEAKEYREKMIAALKEEFKKTPNSKKGETASQSQVDENQKPAVEAGEDMLDDEETETKETYEVKTSFFDSIIGLIHSNDFKLGNTKRDLSVYDFAFNLPVYYKSKIPALRALYDARESMTENRELDISHIMTTANGENYLNMIKDLKKADSLGRDKVSRYLIQKDKDGSSYVMKEIEPARKGDTKTYQILVKNGDGKVLATFSDKDEAWERVFELEWEHLRDNGWSEAMADTVLEWRRLFFRAYKYLFLNITAQTEEAKKLNVDFGYDQNHNDMMEALKRHGQLIGSYFPRIREPGEYSVSGELYVEGETNEKGEPLVRHIMKTFNTKAAADGFATRLSRNHWVNIEVDKMTHSDDAMSDNITSLADITNQILEAANNIKADDASFNDFGLIVKTTAISPEMREINIRLTDAVKEGEEVTKFLLGIAQRNPNMLGTYRIVCPATAEVHMKKFLYGGLAYAIGKGNTTLGRFKKALFDNVSNDILAMGSRARKLEREHLTGDEVTTGYIEDPVKALNLYVASVTAGTSRTRFANEYYSCIMGSNYTFKKFILENHPEIVESIKDEPDFKEKFIQKMKNLRSNPLILAEWHHAQEEHRIDPLRQPKAYNDAKQMLINTLRHDNLVDRIIGFGSGITACYMLSRPSSAFNNLLSMVTAVPAILDKYTHAGIFSIYGAIMRNEKKFMQFYNFGKFGKKCNLSKEDLWLFNEVHRRGWDEAALASEAMRTANTWGSLVFRKLGSGLMKMFSFVEMTNRGATIMAAYDSLVSQMKTPPQTDKQKIDVLRKAKQICDKAHGNYEKWNNPLLVKKTGSWMSWTFLFSKYSRNMISAMLDGGMSKQNIKTSMFMIMAQSVLAGVKVTEFATVIAGILSLLGLCGLAIGGDDKKEYVFQMLEKLFGLRDWDDDSFGTQKRFGRRFLRFGALGALTKVDSTASLSMFDAVKKEVPTTSDQALQLLLGAPYSLFTKAYKGTKNIAQGNVYQGVEQLMPEMASSPMRAFREWKYGVSTQTGEPVYFGKDRLKADNAADVIRRALGFNPLAISEIREQQRSEYEIRQKYSDQRSDIIKRIKNFERLGKSYNSAEWFEILNIIEDYNQSIELNKQPQSIAKPFTERDIQNTVKRAGEVPKNERERDGVPDSGGGRSGRGRGNSNNHIKVWL